MHVNKYIASTQTTSVASIIDIVSVPNNNSIECFLFFHLACVIYNQLVMLYLLYFIAASHMFIVLNVFFYYMVKYLIGFY